MLFNSFTYALFFCLVLAFYWHGRGQARRLWVLFVSSVVFYASWSPPFVLLLFISIGVDYAVSRRIPRASGRGRRLLLLLSMVTNLGILATFKYADFALDGFLDTLTLLGLDGWEREPLGFVLPMGISFYTFQTMSYTIDVYMGRQKPVDSLLGFAVYVTFFPQLVAGPIVRAHEMLPQLASLRRLASDDAFRGVNRILLGLFKKVVIADWLATVIEPVFADPTAYTGLSGLLALYAYAFQIFLDFSGYCDIAIGCALLLGFRLPENFSSPYLAPNLVEFWRCWHVTLSTWLRDYLYIPLGGNRGGPGRVARNLMITMLLGGLWHGASWNFIIWGGIHGAMLVALRAWRHAAPRLQGKAWESFCILGTFNLTCFAWIFFRSASFDQASDMITRIVGIRGGEILVAATISPLLLLLYASMVSVTRRLLRSRPRQRTGELAYGFALGAILLAVSLLSAPGAEFIYFQF